MYICRDVHLYICTNRHHSRLACLLGAPEKTPRRGFLNAFVDVGAVEGQTSRPAACRVNRPDFFERGPGALVPGGLLRLALLRVRHFGRPLRSGAGGVNSGAIISA